MAESVNLPGLGKTKTTWVVAGGAILAGILGYAYYKKAQSSSAAAAAATTTNSGATQTSIDPATGYPYGSTEDEQALQALDSGTYYGVSGGGYGETYEPTYSTSSVPASTTATTNQAWLSNILDSNNTGYSGTQIIQAVTAWFAGVQVSTSELTVIQTVEALYGPPPQSIPAPNVSTTGNTGTQSATGAAPQVTELQVTNNTANSVSLWWQAVAGASGYTVTYRGAGTIGPMIHTSGTSVTVSPLKPNTTYTFNVQATTSAGTGPFATITATTS